ncbi:MAG: hypothetical protein ACYC6G_01830 [Desulfobaccales bacterium]
MPNEPEAVAVARISQDLSEIYTKMMGKAPDPEALLAEAEAFVAKYGPAANLEDMMA